MSASGKCGDPLNPPPPIGEEALFRDAPAVNTGENVKLSLCGSCRASTNKIVEHHQAENAEPGEQQWTAVK